MMVFSRQTSSWTLPGDRNTGWLMATAGGITIAEESFSDVPGSWIRFKSKWMLLLHHHQTYWMKWCSVVLWMQVNGTFYGVCRLYRDRKLRCNGESRKALRWLPAVVRCRDSALHLWATPCGTGNTFPRVFFSDWPTPFNTTVSYNRQQLLKQNKWIAIDTCILLSFSGGLVSFRAILARQISLDMLHCITSSSSRP